MENKNAGAVLVDLRRTKGRVWSYDEASITAPLPDGEDDIDSLLYHGFRQKGAEFLRSVQGRFGAAYHDQAAGVIFLCRDWVGEVPLHYYLTDSSVVVANGIADIQEHLGADQYRYEYVRAVPQSSALVLDAREQYEYERRFRKTWHVRDRVLYYDFAGDVASGRLYDTEIDFKVACRAIHTSLDHSIRQRLQGHPQQRPAVLLSGGLDSLSVAYFLSRAVPGTIAYTLSVGTGGHDVRRAEQIAQHFALEFREVRVSPEKVAAMYAEAVRACELYHIPNVYCAVGMIALGRRLREDGVRVAFCGEGVNEALGDYHDWEVTDPSTRQRRLLQRVDHRQLEKVGGRVRYVWGRAHQEGRYNPQLGSGLAKHGIGRMVKPMLSCGVELESPYLDPRIMKLLVSIPHQRLSVVGGKPGLMAKIFEREIRRGDIPEDFVLDSQKVRLQDASDLGEGGLTPLLLGAGYDQERTISIFNDLFGAHLAPQQEADRLSLCSAS